MGTFHDHLGEWHGHTIVVDTTDGKTIVGRCHEARADRVDLVGADVFVSGRDGLTREQYLESVRKFGWWERHARLRVPGNEVARTQLFREM
ncbi:MAG: hypothetical protein ABFS86_11625 [Planctomycetota bacterium]